MKDCLRLTQNRSLIYHFEPKNIKILAINLKKNFSDEMINTWSVCLAHHESFCS